MELGEGLGYNEMGEEDQSPHACYVLHIMGTLSP